MTYRFFVKFKDAILDEPVALSTEMADVPMRGHEFFNGGLVLTLLIHEFDLRVCLGIAGTLLGGIGHEFLSLFLRKFNAIGNSHCTADD